MTTRKESERTKFIQEKCLTLLTQMLRDEDNKYCVDCDAKGSLCLKKIKAKIVLTFSLLQVLDGHHGISVFFCVFDVLESTGI